MRKDVKREIINWFCESSSFQIELKIASSQRAVTKHLAVFKKNRLHTTKTLLCNYEAINRKLVLRVIERKWERQGTTF